MNRLSVYLPKDKQGRRAASSAPFSHSPLLKGIAPESLRFPEQGGMAVKLGSPFAPMLEALPRLGNALVITRNTNCILGEYRSFPELILNGPGHLAMSRDGSLEFDFHVWKEVFASHEHRPEGHAYALEANDHFKRSLHKICLTPESHFKRFLAFVRQHQESGMGSPSNTNARKQTGLSILQRPPALSGLPEIPKPAFPDFLHYLIDSRSSVEVAVSNPGAKQKTCFIIQEIKKTNGWHFMKGAKAGWHLNLDGITRLSWTRLPACSGALWKIQALGKHDLPAFELGGTCPLPAALANKAMAL